MSHIENFANVGLRTLVAACRVIPEEMATSWLKEYKAAGNSIQQRAELLSACAKQIEKDMVMLGAIGIEDELQDGVPEVTYLYVPVCLFFILYSIDVSPGILKPSLIDRLHALVPTRDFYSPFPRCTRRV